MKLLLTSNGFVNEQIISACEQLVGKDRRDRFNHAVESHRGVIYGLTDESATLVADEKNSVIGSATIYENGKLVEQGIIKDRYES